MAWLILLVAALLEIVWALAMKSSAGFSRIGPSILGVSAAFISFMLLTLALRSLPVGTAYAVWVGLGAAGVFVAGVILMGDAATAPRLVFVGLILAGVVGLRLVEGSAP